MTRQLLAAVIPALLAALLGACAVLVVATMMPRRGERAVGVVLFAGCCDASICSKYALEACPHVRGGDSGGGSGEPSLGLGGGGGAAAQEASDGARPVTWASSRSRRPAEINYPVLALIIARRTSRVAAGADVACSLLTSPVRPQGALKAAKALGLTQDNRRADAKVMSQSLRSLMAKHAGIFCVLSLHFLHT
jgi:hypothetical protein